MKGGGKMNKAQSIAVTIGVAITLILICFGTYAGTVDFDVEKKMCQTMKTSNYEFTHDVQLNAEYSESCFDTLNHPLARTYYVLGGAVVGFFASLIPWLIIFLLYATVFDYY